ncbi:MAG: hypothetical protein KME06_11265 [Kastovskya adunca ATA6-11-RM4]|jgi:HAMP domain-containing protein|nr:hypothetical protein [Kastovskya adunca ATA6-11-RM4]
MEPVTLTAAAIATLAFNKSVETVAEKLTEGGIENLEQLRQNIWQKLRGKPKAEEALTKLEQGSKAELDQVAAYLQIAMDEDDAFAQKVRELAQEIHQQINIDKIQAKGVQNVYGGEGYQSIDNRGQTFQGGKHQHIYPPNP